VKIVKHRAQGVEGGSGSGFTLIEIIITLVIASILAVMLYSYFGTAITHSGDPLIRLNSAMNIQSVMENITSNYKSVYIESSSSFNLEALKPTIGAAGVSMNNSYGQYKVIENHYITFDTNRQEQPDSGSPPSNSYLKVTVQDSTTGEKLTVLFSRQ
jgi:prepilin-type N-terminal cleavage/methylation domain-containing protein